MELTVTVWHRADEKMFRPDAPTWNDSYTEAYSYDTPAPAPGDDTFFGRIWRENNVVEGWENPVTYGARSLSVGDVIELSEPVDGGTVWQVAAFGWEPRMSAFPRLWRTRERLAREWELLEDERV